MQTATVEKRNKYQAYYTPTWAVFELLNYYKDSFPPEVFESYFRQTWLEPCAGDLAIYKSVAYWCGKQESQVPIFYTNDIDKSTSQIYHLDAKETTLYTLTRPFLTISNPPWGKEVDAIVERALENSTVVWMLLRKTWAEGTQKRKFLKTRPFDKEIVLPRYCFSKSKKHPDKWGTDPTTFSWYIWDKNIQDNKTLTLFPEDIEYYYRNPDQGIKKFNQIFV